MAKRTDAIKAAQDASTAYELGTQIANEAIFRAILLTVKQLSGTQGPELFEAIKKSVELSISNAKIDNPEATKILQSSAGMVVESVFDGLNKP